MESKRLGLCNKSLFVVPNHLIEQFSNEFLQLYSSANILVTTKKDFSTNNRKKFCSKIATGDFDAIVMGHSQFEKIPMSVERQRYFLEQQIEEIIQGIEEIKEISGEKFTIRQLEKTRKSLEAKLEKETVIIGVGTRLEIWDKETWQNCDENISADEIAENMANLGI